MRRSVEAKADVIVVGAGVIGCATSYFLARKGAKVVMVEKEAVGAGASFHATGLLGSATSSQLSETAFRLSLETIPRLHEETGIDPGLKVQEALYVALTEQQLQQAKTMALMPGFAGTERAFVEGDEVLKLEPRLSSKVLGALWLSKAAQVDSYRYTLALARGAEQAGTRIVTGLVTGLMRRKDRVTGVVTHTGAIEADSVVLATGAWVGESEKWFDMQIPVRSQKGQNMRLRWDGKPFQYIIRQVGWGHLIQRADGFLSAGSTEEEDRGFDTSPTVQARAQIMEHVLSVMPCLETAEVVNEFAGPRPKSADNLPLMGPVTTLPGLYLNSGHGGSGVFLAAASGLHLAELVLSGTSSVLPTAPYLPSRFNARPHRL